MPLQRIKEPTAQPITAAYVKAHTRIDHNADDDFLTNLLIPAAVGLAENYLRRSFCTQTWALTLDSFPGPSLMGVPWGTAYSLPEHAILLERPPILSITSIAYIGLDFNQYSMLPYVPGTGPPPTGGTDGAYSFVDLTYGGTVRSDDPLRITPPFGQIWPINLPEIGSAVVTYQAGYGGAQGSSPAPSNGIAVPAPIQQWIAMNVATLYENRERCVVGTRVTVSELPYVDHLMDAYVVEIN